MASLADRKHLYILDNHQIILVEMLDHMMQQLGCLIDIEFMKNVTHHQYVRARRSIYLWPSSKEFIERACISAAVNLQIDRELHNLLYVLWKIDSKIYPFAIGM